jgi:phosphonate transport system substrate-binding protein
MNPSVLRVASCMAPNADDTCREITCHLGRWLGVRTEYIDHISWQERERLLDAGEIHLCWLCGLPYVWKADRASPLIELVAAPVMMNARYGDQAVYYSDVVVHRQSRFHVFGDLRGTRWAYNEPCSHSGYNVVLDHLHGLGETEGYFGNAVESGAHQISLNMIVDGEVDASAIDSTVLEAQLNRFPNLCGQIRVIDTLGPSPMPPWVMLRRLPDELKCRIRNFFMDMACNAEGRKILETWGIARFAATEDEGYDLIRRMARNTERVRLSA